LERIAIHTGLYRFILVDAITDIGDRSIRGEVDFADADPTLLLESLAQLGGLHVRAAIDFRRHAFLVRISDTAVPFNRSLCGRYLLQGTLVSRSGNAFSYLMEARQNTEIVMEGNFLFGAIDYDAAFRQDILQDHYRDVFSCLKKS
jgi:hypothetical protein